MPKLDSNSTGEQFYKFGLRGFNRAKQHGYSPQPPRGARGSQNALYLLAHGWKRGIRKSVGFISAQFWLHPCVDDVCDTTGALSETRRAKKTGKWDNGDVFTVTR